MKSFVIQVSILTVAIFAGLTLSVQAFEMKSEDISEGHHMDKTFEYKGFGCDGDNLSPMLEWSNPPERTKSFALTVYDPDAPTGSGWWHWIVTDIPKDVSGLPQGAGSRGSQLPKGSQSHSNDFGSKQFGGACPPENDGMHRYQFTVWALPDEKLSLADDATPALIGYMLNAKSLGKATITATYAR